MNMGRFFTLGLVLVLLSINGDAGYNNSSNGCNDGERQALLKFKTSLKDPSHKLSSWEEGTDCCKWKGVGCDTSTGARHVVKLDLGREYTTGFGFVSMISCLVELKYLNYLDLSGNYFDGWAADGNMVPAFLGVIKGLEYLSLAYSNTGNLIVPQLGDLTNLQVLDLSDIVTFSGSYVVMEDLQWVSRLSSLKHLDMSGMELYGAHNLWQVLGMLPSLSVLALSNCGLNDTHLFPTHLNSTLLSSIQELYLRGNFLEGRFPQFVENMTSLRVLDLSNDLSLPGINFVNTSIPMWLGNLKNLIHLDLSVSNFDRVEGGLSNFLCNLCYLKTLYLYENTFSEESLETNQNSSRCIGYDLEVLNVANSGLKGYLPDWLGQFKKLKELDLSSNSLHGRIPASIGNLLALIELQLSNNQLNGVIPDSIGQLSQLKYMNLSSNTLKGPLPKWFQNLPLIVLDLSHNQITGPIPQNIADAFPSLATVQLAHNLINGTIPSSFCEMEWLSTLDLSHNMLSGDIPDCWTWENQFLRIIRLSSNNLTGVIPSSFGNLFVLSFLHLNNNSLKGEIPVSFQRMSVGLIILNLGDNGFSGNIPKWIGTHMTYLQILTLRKNMFDGYIPPQLCQLEYLQILDLAGNNLIGTIPRCFGNLTGMISKPNIYEQGIHHRIPPFFQDGWEKQNVEVVMKGMDQEYTTILKFVVNMDLSGNKLVGLIPEELSHLSELISLDLSRNHLTGNIPKNIGSLKTLESLDLSKNQLSGNIPTSMSNIPRLSYLNLSHNNFSGKIPTGQQLQTLVDPSIYADNPELCGDPLLKRCPGDEPPHQVPKPATSHEENDEEDKKSDKIWFYLAITLGYGTGLWIVIGVLLFKKKWRYAYFRFADETKDRIYVAIVVNAARLKKKIMERNCDV